MAAYEWNPALLSMTIDATLAGLGTFIVDGFTDGTMVTIERSEPTYAAPRASADGKVNTWSKKPNRNGTITFTLDAAAPANALLRQLADADESSSTGVVAVKIADNAGGAEKAFSPQSRLMGHPSMSFETEAGTRQWSLGCTELDIDADGAVQL